LKHSVIINELTGELLLKLIIPGNCQAQLLEAMFATATPSVSVTRLEPAFRMREERKDEVLQAMADADFIFAQRTSDDFFLPWLTPGGLRAAFGAKCLIWPNIYFDGYFPNTQYIYKHGIGKLSSPLQDYHLAPLISAHRLGKSVEGAVKEIEQLAAAGDACFEASFTELEQREQDVDVAISDFLRAGASRRRVVYTPNHPYNDVLAELGARLGREAGIAFDQDAAAGIRYVLDRIYLPAFPSIVKDLSLPFDAATLFRGVEVEEVAPGRIALGNAREYSLQEVVEAYWRIYDTFSP
jgi:hypothetical protein